MASSSAVGAHIDLANQSAFLLDWFSRYGSEPRYEIEARIKDVQPQEYASILTKLQSNPVRGGAERLLSAV